MATIQNNSNPYRDILSLGLLGGVDPETGMPDGVTMSGLPFQIDESSTVQTEQSPEGSYVPITGADLGLPMGPGVPAPAGVEMGDPFQIVQSGGTPDWITNAQNPSPVNLPPYSNPMLSGQAYASLISGGQAVPSMIAPGVSYGMNSPMGYTAPGASAVPYPSYQPPEGVVVNNPNANPYPDYTNSYNVKNPYYDALTNQEEGDALAQLLDYVRKNVNLSGLQDRIENPLEDIPTSLLDTTPVVDTRPATVSPLGSLDTSYINDIDFSSLLNTPNPQVDFPIEPPAVIDSAIENLPVYQDPIMSMVDPVVSNEIQVTDTMAQEYPTLGANLFNNETVIPAAAQIPPSYDEVISAYSDPVVVPEVVPTISAPTLTVANPQLDFPVATPVVTANPQTEAIQNIIEAVGLLDETPSAAPMLQTPNIVTSLLDSNPQVDFPVAQTLIPEVAPATPIATPVLAQVAPQLDLSLFSSLIPEAVAVPEVPPILNARGEPLSAQQMEEYIKVSKQMADATGTRNPFALPQVSTTPKRVVPSFNRATPRRVM